MGQLSALPCKRIKVAVLKQVQTDQSVIKYGSTLKLVENMVLVRLKYQWRKGQEHFKTKYQAPLSVIQLGGRFSLPDFH